MSHLHTINREQHLYVLRCGNGYTCLGFGVCEERKRALAAELGVTLAGHPAGTRQAYTEYHRLVKLAAQRNRQTGWKSQSELTPQLKGLEGWRVEVVDRWNQRRRFLVGRSTGYIPVHLELARRDSSGGPAVVGGPFVSVRRLERVR
jgi:hypothetical protein